MCVIAPRDALKPCPGRRDGGPWGRDLDDNNRDGCFLSIYLSGSTSFVCLLNKYEAGVGVGARRLTYIYYLIDPHNCGEDILVLFM